MARFLVTGGAGFIGSNIAESLIAQGHFVRVLDNFYSGKEENLAFAKGLKGNSFELVKGDVRDYKISEKACQGIDFVHHHAALRSVPESVKEPEKYNDINIGGTLVMLKAALNAKVKRFVFASSSSIYGDTDIFPQKESDPPLLISPYALSKLTGEYYCRIFSEIHHLETVCLRYFNVFGPKQALDDEYAVVIPRFINCVIKGEPTPIFGDGQQSRDFVFIESVVLANLLAATTPNIKHDIFNVADGEGVTILELSQKINAILGKNISPKFLPIRPGDVLKTLADISKINHKLGYKSAVNFNDGLKKTIQFFQK